MSNHTSTIHINVDTKVKIEATTHKNYNQETERQAYNLK